jgi:GntR family transcriptional regulator, transcriptional repressor for pyruvate dehydrogenase complex
MLHQSRSDQLAEALRAQILEGELQVGARLPSEQMIATLYQVSRTVVREAVAQLKSEGLLRTSQGRAATVLAVTLGSDRSLAVPRSIKGLLGFLEVRRAIEAEMAGLAAERRTASQCRAIRKALFAIEDQMREGGDGVQEDLDFHLAIGRATSNAYWGQFVQMFAGPMRSAIRVTRANEARREDFAASVVKEHRRIYEAIEASAPEQARTAVKVHLAGAAQRLLKADRDFWKSEGENLARDWLQVSEMRVAQDLPETRMRRASKRV